MSEGFVRLSRGYFSHPFWTEKRAFSRAEAWLDLVATCAFEPRKQIVNGELIEIPRGGIAATERFLSDRWMWSRTKVRAFLDILEAEKMIKDHQKNRRFSVFLLCNFDRFNPQKEPPKEPPKDQRSTTGKPPGNQIEEEEELKKGETEPPPPPEIPDEDKPCRSYAPRKTEAIAYSKTKQGWQQEVTVKWWNLREQQEWQDQIGRPLKNWRLNLENWQMDEHKKFGCRPGQNGNASKFQNRNII